MKTLNHLTCVGFVGLMVSTLGWSAEDKPAPRLIKIVKPKLLAGDDVPAVRTPLGIPNDDKLWIVQLKNGELLIVAFCFGGQPSNKLPAGEPYLERAVFRRSKDGGKTWGPREERSDIHGREFALTCLQDGRLLLTFTVRSNSTDGHPLGLRALISPDDGETWDFTHDRIVLSDRNHGASGGGFGNSIQLKDATLVSVYSFRGEDGNTHVEAVGWTLLKAQSKP